MAHEEIIYDINTKETTVRPYTAEEIADNEAEALKVQTAKDAAAEIEAQKIALFEKLGITTDEAKILFS